MKTQTITMVASALMNFDILCAPGVSRCISSVPVVKWIFIVTAVLCAEKQNVNHSVIRVFVI